MKWTLPLVFALASTMPMYAKSLPVWEQDAIRAALKRNQVDTKFFPIVAAIRHQENGQSGLDFGIIHPKAKTYGTQAGWCVCTVSKNFQRWNGEGSFIEFLGQRYCPTVRTDVWIRNVKYWAEFYGSRIK